MKLISSKAYKRATEEEKKLICNGCGKRGLGGWLVPDTLYGLSIEEACNIHDFDYHEGETWEDKKRADANFLSNMLIIINSKTGFFHKLLAPLRRIRAMNYYNAVKEFGKGAFR